MADNQTRSKAEIQAEIAAARERLAGNVEGLISQMHPQAIMQRGVDDARAFASSEFANAKAQVIDPESGELKTERVALIAGAVAGIVTFLFILRSIVQGIKKSR